MRALTALYSTVYAVSESVVREAAALTSRGHARLRRWVAGGCDPGSDALAAVGDLLVQLLRLSARRRTLPLTADRRRPD